MSGISKKLMGTTAAGGGFTAIEDVFSTYLYTGNGSTQTITNGIDLAGEGGLVWIKLRNSASNNELYDTERGATNSLSSNITNETIVRSTGLTSFNSDGFDLGSATNVNANNYNVASWTFRKAPRFFDVVTYTGTGVNGRTVSHNLGVEPGMIVVKQTSGTEPWMVYHRSLGSLARLNLNNTNQAVTGNDEPWYGVDPTSTEFTVAYNSANASGGTYVAYLFAHDPLGPSGDGSDGLIACGSFTTDGSGNAVVDLGWEPSWLMIKRTSNVGNWEITDDMRGFGPGASTDLKANVSDAESAPEANKVFATARGFEANVSSSSDYIYIAIRRGPMRAPESGTEVFAPTLGVSTVPSFVSNFPVDLALAGFRTNADKWYTVDRLRGAFRLDTASTSAEAGQGGFGLDYMNGAASIFNGYLGYMFRRAPGFFDVVAYTGDGVAGRTVPHNLGVAPEMMIVKARNDVRNWIVYHSATTATSWLELNKTQEVNASSTYWNNTSPTATEFTLGTASAVNLSSSFTYIAYLFATLPGVSKVGSYTGNGTSQTIDCGFTSGARFVLIKRTDSTGDWYVWDTARGIVTGNDPFLKLNTTDAEVTSDDSIDPDSSGFIVNETSTTNVNVSSASYIFYAVS